MKIIEIVDYRDSWKTDFDIEKKLLEHALSACDVTVHHIGSTSVPNLAAKPIIDILLEVSSLDILDTLNSNMRELSYLPKGEYGIAGRRYYQKGGAMRTHQVHAFLRGSQDVIRHLAYRDYLIEHPNIASKYEEIKRKGAEASNNDISDYCAYKNDFVQHHQALALEWWAVNKRLKSCG